MKLDKAVRRAALLHRIGSYFLARSADVLASAPKRANLHGTLQADIEAVLRRYRADAGTFKYFYGHPYQGLAIAGVFGDRLCDPRFDEYALREHIRPSDRVLDIGCNCGFMAILAAYRIGCRAEGIDINPYMIEIGRLVADHLGVGWLVRLHAGRLQEFRPDPFDVVMSFATHWTDDENYRVSIREHMERMRSYLKPGGKLVFESHCNDVGQPRFYSALEGCRDLFAWSGHRLVDGGHRELYVMTASARR